ncbi:MAG: hypothetical protein AB9869_04670 [Verrucomicrobiia bacterium]
MKDPKNVLSTPEEWDFRGVTELELPHVLRYEYAREDKTFVERATRWLGARIRGKTVREHLLSDDPEGDCLFPLVQRDGGRNTEFWFLLAHPLFPLPWFALDESDRREFCVEANWQPEPVYFFPTARLAGVDAVRADAVRAYDYLMRIDFRSAKLAEIVAVFERWARKEAKKQAGRKKLVGRASARPFHLLKSLAALRLKKAGMTQAEAFRFVIAYKARHPLDDSQTAVLPKFGETGGSWQDAIARASSVAANHWEL